MKHIFAQAVPATHAHATVVIQFRGESGEKATLKIEINRPNGNALTKLEGPVQISEQGGAGVQLKLQNLSLPDYGKYSLNVILDDKTARTLVFSVMKPPHAPRPH